ncbi:hypothetical protein Slin15195_G045250 [Septoria linicola]|uniref:Uncharacterized protein n=1 Tax=Septoria linicola TaxID=215465 RepID=A0A9Q9AV20_9PEZI|nr:hypothetical protein Slin14017_G048770 [Septoria linicola]USW51206.1 hypothetical protein Slin15195_G045250 [Septoria linicola]
MSLTRFTRLSTRISTRQFSVYTSKMADKPSLDASEPNSVGRQFESDGKIGATAEKVGGPFASDGKIGEKFEKGGAIGGTMQEASQKSVFDKDGVVGRAFKADGKIGSAADSVGGPFSKDGIIGSAFTEDGAIGGTIQGGTKSEKS